MLLTAVETLAQIIASGFPPGNAKEIDSRGAETAEAIKALFGERYSARSAYRQRVVLFSGKDDNIPFAGLVHEDAPDSGVYGGMSLIWFPVAASEDRPASSLLTLVCGTRGLSPDEHILGRPGHARHLQGLHRLLATIGVPTWVKYDPTDLGQPVPRIIQRHFPQYEGVFKRYGNYIYCAAEVPQESSKATTVVSAFLDLYAWERGWTPLKAAAAEIASFKTNLRKHLFPRVSQDQILKLLYERRFVILQGPPGTGKTRLAKALLRDGFAEQGIHVQFHPAITYETFVAGITPAVAEKSLLFNISPGWLVQAVRKAQDSKFLLLIDEVNRADLSRVLGEAIYLFEPREIAAGTLGSVRLPHKLDDGTEELTLPDSLYVLGTMNSADRSIAILDMAVRRRFAFVDVWPDLEVIETQGSPLATDAFSRLQDIFIEYSADDALVLLPGHAYFLADSEEELKTRLRFELIPLLQEYIHDGRLGGCESEIRAYMGWLESEIGNGC